MDAGIDTATAVQELVVPSIRERTYSAVHIREVPVEAGRGRFAHSEGGSAKNVRNSADAALYNPSNLYHRHTVNSVESVYLVLRLDILRRPTSRQRQARALPPIFNHLFGFRE